MMLDELTIVEVMNRIEKIDSDVTIERKPDGVSIKTYR